MGKGDVYIALLMIVFVLAVFFIDRTANEDVILTPAQEGDITVCHRGGCSDKLSTVEVCTDKPVCDCGSGWYEKPIWIGWWVCPSCDYVDVTDENKCEIAGEIAGRGGFRSTGPESKCGRGCDYDGKRKFYEGEVGNCCTVIYDIYCSTDDSCPNEPTGLFS